MQNHSLFGLYRIFCQTTKCFLCDFQTCGQENNFRPLSDHLAWPGKRSNFLFSREIYLRLACRLCNLFCLLFLRFIFLICPYFPFSCLFLIFPALTFLLFPWLPFIPVICLFCSVKRLLFAVYFFLSLPLAPYLHFILFPFIFLDLRLILLY